MSIEGRPTDPTDDAEREGVPLLRSVLTHPSVVAKILASTPSMESQLAGGLFPDPSAYWDLFWLAPAAYLVTDAAAVVREANAAAEALLRRSRNELIGSSLLQFVGSGQRTEMEERLTRLAKGEVIHDWEMELTVASPPSPLTVSVAVANGGVHEGKVAGFRWVLHDVTDRKRFETRVAYMAYHDSLTGLPNRAMFDEFLAIALARARRSGVAVALLCLDLDGFKAVNDRFGHAAGDAVLRQVGGRLLAVSRGSDVVGRLGGDEFAILLADLDMADVRKGVGDRRPTLVADRVRKALRPSCFVGERAVRISASIGISAFPLDATTEADLVASADAAMYEAKRAGRRGGGPGPDEVSGPRPLT